MGFQNNLSNPSNFNGGFPPMQNPSMNPNFNNQMNPQPMNFIPSNPNNFGFSNPNGQQYYNPMQPINSPMTYGNQPININMVQ